MGRPYQSSLEESQAFAGHAGTLITAEALLAAVVLVWAQLWGQSSISMEIFPDVHPGLMWRVMLPAAEFGGMWTFGAVLYALCALALTAFRLASRTQPTVGVRKLKIGVEDLAVGSFSAGLELAILNVGLSAASALLASLKYAGSESYLKTIEAYVAVGLTCLPTHLVWLTLSTIVVAGVSAVGAATSFRKGNGRWLAVWVGCNSAFVLALAFFAALRQYQAGSPSGSWVWAAPVAVAILALVTIHVVRSGASARAQDWKL